MKILIALAILLTAGILGGIGYALLLYEWDRASTVLNGVDNWWQL